MNPYGYGYGMMGGSWIGGLLMLALWLLVIAGLVMLVVWAVRGGTRHHPQAPTPPQAHDEAVAIAKRRFASGEITREQFDEIMRGLGS